MEGTDERTPEEFDDEITNELEFLACPRRRDCRRMRQDPRRGRPAHAPGQGLPDRRPGRPPAGTSGERPERFFVVTCAGVRFDDEYVVVRLPTGGFHAFNADFRGPKVINHLRLSGPADGEREVLAPPLAPTSCEPTPTLVNDRKTTAESPTTVDSARPVASPDSGSSSDALTVPGKASREWRRPGSNRQPPACKAGALPIELRPRRVIPAVVSTLDGE